MASKAIDQAIREDWQELGFFYDRDDSQKYWRILGSVEGLLKFCDLLRAYVGDARNAQVSEHEHYGPYGYLKVMTWPEASLNKCDIRGSLKDLAGLENVLRSKLGSSRPGETIVIVRSFLQRVNTH